jgi:hypothetical protein
MNPAKPVCPEHKTAMRYSTMNIEQGRRLTLRGKQIENKFHYCRDDRCTWRYSSDLGDYFKADELPASQPTSGLPPLSRR